MLIDIIVTWVDAHKIVPHHQQTIQVRKRPTEEDYFKGGLLNQAMRQAGYSEEEIHAEHYVGPVEFQFKQEKPQFKKICDECGSTDVRIDAWASWNEEIQDWELAETYENPFCMDCELSCRIDDEVITP